MLKGKTTIQLFDAKTGEKTDEVTKTNLVTNAVRNALGGPFNYLAMSNQWSNGMDNAKYLYRLPYGKNFAQTLYGGVLIFSKPITEDVDHCLPSIEEIKTFIGCANQSASDGSDSFRGSINEGESEIGTNYVKFVWDFKTNECNGDIASICLTSDLGGKVGYGFDAYESSYMGRSLRGFYNTYFWDVNTEHDIYATNTSSGFTGYGALACFFSTSENYYSNSSISYIDGDYFYTISEGIARRVNISRITSKDNFGLSVVDGFNYGYVNLNFSESFDTGVVEYAHIQYTSKNCAYAEESGSSNSEFKLIKYYGEGLAERITIPASNINSAIASYYNKSNQGNYLSNQIKIIHNDKIYCITYQFNFPDLEANPNKLRVWVINFDGTYTFKDVDITDKFVDFIAGTKNVDGNSTYGEYDILGEYRGSLYYASGYKTNNSNGYICFLIDDDGTMHTRPFMVNKVNTYDLNFNFLDNTDIIPSPYITVSRYRCIDSSSSDATILYYPVLVSAYLGTINNQETVLTKTADKTMKIIYTLTQA